MVPVERADLVTSDMDMLADLVRQLYFEHSASFRCPDPSAVEARMHSVTAGGLNASLARYGGVAYTAEVEPTNPPMAVVCFQGSGVITSGQEELRQVDGEMFLLPADRPVTVTDATGRKFVTLQIPWEAARSLAEESAGIPAADLRFGAMTPVSAARQRAFARTAEFICGQLVTSGIAGLPPLIVPELTRVASVAFLETFPSTAMTVAYTGEPGWVAPAAVRQAVAFIHAHAGQPVTPDQFAAAAGVTGRALRYAFRRYFDVTPMGYLRRVRLEQAHQELLAAGPASGLTVQAVARRWGWASHSRFTVDYQQRFGVLPSSTLRS